MKSSIKFCVVATGEYDLYVAEPRASEWDIGAGHAILKNAGGEISDFNGNEILYGKKDFKNSSIILNEFILNLKHNLMIEVEDAPLYSSSLTLKMLPQALVIYNLDCHRKAMAYFYS